MIFGDSGIAFLIFTFNHSIDSIRKNCDGSGPVIWTDLRFDALDGFGPLGRRLAWKVERDLMSFGETEIRDAFHSRKGDVRRDQI